jgi:hypothetical protein
VSRLVQSFPHAWYVFTSACVRFALNAILLRPSIPHAPRYLLVNAIQNGKPVCSTSSDAPCSRRA